MRVFGRFNTAVLPIHSVDAGWFQKLLPVTSKNLQNIFCKFTKCSTNRAEVVRIDFMAGLTGSIRAHTDHVLADSYCSINFLNAEIFSTWFLSMFEKVADDRLTLRSRATGHFLHFFSSPRKHCFY